MRAPDAKKISREWAELERIEIRKAYKKLLEMGLVDKNMNEIPRRGFTAEKIVELFRRYTEHFRRELNEDVLQIDFISHIPDRLVKLNGRFI